MFARDKTALPFKATPDMPLAILTGLSSPQGLPPHQLAENMASLLNDQPAPHGMGYTTGSLFYSRTPQGITLRTRDAGCVSVPAVQIHISHKSSAADLGQVLLAKMDNQYMEKLCRSLTAGATGPKGPKVSAPAGP